MINQSVVFLLLTKLSWLFDEIASGRWHPEVIYSGNWKHTHFSICPVTSTLRIASLCEIAALDASRNRACRLSKSFLHSTKVSKLLLATFYRGFSWLNLLHFNVNQTNENEQPSYNRMAANWVILINYLVNKQAFKLWQALRCVHMFTKGVKTVWTTLNQFAISEQKNAQKVAWQDGKWHKSEIYPHLAQFLAV